MLRARKLAKNTIRFVVCAALIGCGGTDPAPPKDGSDTAVLDDSPFDDFDEPKPDIKQTAPITSIRFNDVASQIGLPHKYNNGAQGESIMVETTGGGAGWLDFDRDGNWDLIANQGGIPTLPATDAQPTDRIYRNLGGTFTDVTTSTFVNDVAYGQGVAVGDFDGDGFDDIYVTNVGKNTLWRNLGDGTFADAGEDAGVADPRWSSSAAWADLNGDALLDLYVCNYLQYDPLDPVLCANAKGEKRICHPKDLQPWPDECYINQGDGTFTAEAKKRGLVGEGNKALGVVVADFNNDGLPDIYVANDTTANFLFLNQGDGQFKESGVNSGCAVDRHGNFQASMGIGVADIDGNGYLDIYLTHFHEEANTLYLNLGAAGFYDATVNVGLRQPTMPYLAFGVFIADFDQNRHHDIYVTNGHVENYADNPLYEMTDQVLAFDGTAWQDASAHAGKFFQRKSVGRGVAAADYDNDGDWDLAVVTQNQPLPLLQNDSDRGHWLKLDFQGTGTNRRGIGCIARVTTTDGTQMQQLYGGGSYASCHQPILIFGLAGASQCDIQVTWPDGQEQVIKNATVDRNYLFDQRAR